MATRFDINITATDSASSTIQAVGRKITAVNDTVGTSFDQVQVSARSVADAVTSIIPPLNVIASAATVGGLASLVERFAQAGTSIWRMSTVSGIAADMLQSLGMANELVGGSAAGLQQALVNLGNTLEAAHFGRNAEALAMLNQLGIRFEVVHGRAVNVIGVFKQLVDAVGRFQGAPQTQAVITSRLGLDEALPLMQQGNRAIAEMQEQIGRTGSIIENVELSKEWTKQLQLTGDAIAGVGNQIVTKLSPALLPLVEGFRDWISVNRPLVADLAAGVGAASLAGSIAMVTRAVTGLTGAVLANPLTLFVTTAVAAAIAIYENWDKVRVLWEDLKRDWAEFKAGGPTEERKKEMDKSDRETAEKLNQVIGGSPTDVLNAFNDALRRSLPAWMTPSQYAAPIGPTMPAISGPAAGAPVTFAMPAPLAGPYSGAAAAREAAGGERAPVGTTGPRDRQEITVTFDNLPPGWDPRVSRGTNLATGRSMSEAQQ